MQFSQVAAEVASLEVEVEVVLALVAMVPVTHLIAQIIHLLMLFSNQVRSYQ